jgi:uncharacterized protein with PIN domain
MVKERRIRYIVLGQGNECPKCKQNMERRGHKEIPTKKTYYYKKWDYCKPCGHVQHYEEFKSSQWVEDERQDLFFNNLR